MKLSMLSKFDRHLNTPQSIESNLNIFNFSTAYKCAVFFGNLTESRPLTWIGALPDALSKASSPEEAKAILGADVTEESFEDLPNCDDVTANARCYAIVSEDWIDA